MATKRSGVSTLSEASLKSNSYHTWSPVPVQLRSLDLGYTGSLHWDQSPAKTKRNVSVIPYALGSYFKDFEEDQPKETEVRVGVDAKVAITSSLNLDLTINPDFSQVDVDEQVTNLNTFNVRFPERRLFFLENSDSVQRFWYSANADLSSPVGSAWMMMAIQFPFCMVLG